MKYHNGETVSVGDRVKSSAERDVVIYDLDGRLISQTLGNGQRTLTYNPNGNITAISGDTNQTYGYDTLNRLTAANDDANSLAWEYDANGNRLSQDNSGTVTAYTLDPASNRLTAIAATTYSYDANGNLINDGNHTYQYDAQNRLIAIDNGDTAEYHYNPLGQRILKIALDENCGDNGKHKGDDKDREKGKKQRDEGDKYHHNNQHEWHENITCIERHRKEKDDHKKHDGKEEKDKESARQREHNRQNHGYSERHFAYDDHRLLGEYNRKGKVVQETIWLGNLPVATVKHGKVYAIHSDHLGTPRVITDKTNLEIWRWDSDPFGMAAANEDPDGDRRLFSYNLRFPGQYFDKETGKHYNYFRDYDPVTGRYIESDPIGLVGGSNTYTYVRGNPLRQIDPSGLFCTSDFLWHYIFGQGKAIYLSSVGLLGSFQNAGSVRNATSSFHGVVQQKAVDMAKSLCQGGNCNKPSTASAQFYVNDSVSTNVTNDECLFSVGHSAFFRKAGCTVTANCSSRTYSYSCGMNFWINDAFIDALDIYDSVPGNQDAPQGTPFKIYANWQESTSGAGGF